MCEAPLKIDLSRRYLDLESEELRKGGRWMPRVTEAMKDVLGCDKLRGAAKKL